MKYIFSNRLKELRKFLGLDQDQMAQKIGVHKQTLSRYERGEIIPSGDVLSKYAKEFGANPEWILLGTGAMFRSHGVSFQIEKPGEGLAKGPIKEGNGIAEEIRRDPKLNDIFKILRGNPETRDAVYELLAGTKQFERAAKIMKKLIDKKIEALTLADLREDPILADINKILKKNPAAKHTIYKFLETDMSCARSLEIFKKHFDDKFAEKINPSPGNSAGI